MRSRMTGRGFGLVDSFSDDLGRLAVRIWSLQAMRSLSVSVQ